MDLQVERSTSVDDPDEVRVPAPGGADALAADAGLLLRDLTDDERLDEFWRRRSSIGHC
ncbi:MAG: hypothetical protein ACLPVY_13595 [Acidimicrobiia bacterium]